MDFSKTKELLQMIDLRQSTKYGQYMERIGWQIEKIDDCQIFVRKIPFFGSVIKIQRSPSVSLDKLDQLAKLNRAFLVSVEPVNEEIIPEFLKNGFRLSPDGMIPSKTRQIDLTPDEQAIFQSFNRTRKYKIGKARRNNFQIKTEGIDDFVNLWSQNALSRGFWVPIKNQIKAMYEVFGENAYLLGAYSLGNLSDLLAGILLLIHGSTASYCYAASSPLGRKLCAPSLLTWEAMKLAKSKGCKIFDFEGIQDERFPKKGWNGFSYFKESFGGTIVTFPGRYIKTYGLFSRLLFR